jgi:hypothetical protein
MLAACHASPARTIITEKVLLKQNEIERDASSKTERDAGVVRSNDLLARALFT